MLGGGVDEANLDEEGPTPVIAGAHHGPGITTR